jgi:hypothetical protein
MHGTKIIRSEVELRKMLKDLLGLEAGLTEWEVNFIEDLSHRKKAFSKGQAEKIEQVWNKHF